MSYLKESTHYRNWLFTEEELHLVAQLKHLKARKALRLARHGSAQQQQQQQQQQLSALHNRTIIKPRSFAALIPSSSTAIRDENDWNEELDLAQAQQQDQQEQEQFETQQQQQQQQQQLSMPEFLTREEEAAFLGFYQEKIQESCAQLFRTSDKVKACAVMLYKRFYLSNSAMEFHPKYLVPTCIYVAAKVEEQYISVDTIAEQLQVDHKYVIGHEMVLLEGVRFQLIMYHPFRACLGFVDEFRNFCKRQQQEIPLEVLQQLHSNSCVVINELLLTDLPLLYTSSCLAMAALYIVAKQLASKGKAKHEENQPHHHKSTRVAELNDVQVLQFFEETQRKELKQDAVPMQLFRKTLATMEAKYQQLVQLKQPVAQQAKDQAVTRTKLVKAVYKKLKQFFPDEDSSKSNGKKRKAQSNGKGDDKDTKKDKKKKHKHKKDKKATTEPEK